MADRQDSPIESASAPARRPRPRLRLRTTQEARQWRRRIAGYALVGVSFILVVNALVGENGYLATMRARSDSAELTSRLRRLREENQRTQEQIERLKSDPTALEEAARRDLRLGKPGETMVVIKDAPKTTKPGAPETPHAPGR